MWLNCCHLMIKLSRMRSCSLMDEQRILFLQMKSTPDEDAINSVEMTAKDLEYCLNLVEEAVADFEKIDSQLWKKFCGYNAIKLHCMLQKNHLWVYQCGKFHCFKKLPHPPQLSATTTLISQLPSMSRQDLHQQKDYNSLKALMMFSIF